MNEMKRCQQCGLLKEAKNFRPYTYAKNKGTQGRYRICRQCESINSNYRRAVEMLKDTHIIGTPELRTASELRRKTETLYEQLKARGLRVPNFTTNPRSSDQAFQAIDAILEFYAEDPTAVKTPTSFTGTDVPADLSHWLNTSWDEWLENDLSPEYLQETVYESLKAKYRPQIGIDKDKLLPIYDDTYKDVLNQILRRFDDYEEYVAQQSEQEGAE
jgi:hypothetical protein